MATLKTKFMVGVFVIVGFSMAVVAVIWLGMSNYMEKGRFYVAYFDESVQGLDKDSPVKYRGVTIGSVNSIGVAPDVNLIQVVLKIDSDMQLDDSIVAQLKSVGITGIMFVELEKQSTDAPAPVQQIEFPAPYPVIGTKPSDIKQFFDTLTEVMGAFNQVDLQRIADRLNAALVEIEQAVADAQIAALVSDIRATLANVQTITTEKKWEAAFASLDRAAEAFASFAAAGTRAAGSAGTTLNRIDTVVTANEKTLQSLMADLQASVRRIDAFVATGSRFIENTHKDTARLIPQMQATLRHYEKAGRHLTRFLERIAEQPSQLIISTPPEEADFGRQ